MKEIAEAERKAKEANNPKNGKKPNKFIEFVKKHKALSFVIGAIILFFVAFGTTMGIVELVNPKDVQIPDLVNKTQSEMMKVRNLGKKSLDEVTNKLHSLGLDFAPDDD